MKWPLAALTLTRTSSTSVNLIALPVPTTPDTGHGAWARATCHPIHAEFARAGAMMPIARKTALAEQVCDSEWGRHAGGLTDTYTDRLPTVIATLFHSLSCS